MAISPVRNPLNAFRRVLWIGLALLVLSAIGTIGFHFVEGWSWLDSLFMVVITFSSIGYEEVHPLSRAGREFTIVLIGCGAVMVALGIGTLTQALLEFELLQFFGRRRVERQIAGLSGHYILCGAGRVGRSAARELARKPVPFVIIEQSDTKAERYSNEWLMLVGDATQEQTLRQAQIENARGLVAATTTDATNLYIVLTARGLNPRLKIIARASEEDAEKHLLTAGADSVVSPYLFAGQRIAQSFLRPHVVSFLDTATTHLGMDLEIGEISVPKHSSFAGKTIESSRIRQDRGVIILAIKREQGMRFNPSPEDRIEPGDYLIAMGEPGQLRQLEQMAVARS